MSQIFGSGNPLFTYSSSSCALDYAVYKSVNFIDVDSLLHKSVLDGTRNYIFNGHYSSFVVSVNLFRYNDPLTKFLEIYSYLHKDVVFYPYSGSNSIKDDTGTAVPFHITNMNLYFKENTGEYDVVDIVFESTKYTNLSGSLA